MDWLFQQVIVELQRNGKTQVFTYVDVFAHSGAITMVDFTGLDVPVRWLCVFSVVSVK